MSKVVDHSYIAATIVFTVYSQLVLRWQVGLAGAAPAEFADKLRFVLTLLRNAWVLSGICATFLAGVSWMFAMTRFELGYAYPFMSVAFVIVVVLGALLYGETVDRRRILGTGLVVVGLVLIARA